MDLKVDKICRICMSRDYNMHNLFQPTHVAETVLLADVIDILTGSQLVPGDGLPTNACAVCYIELNRIYEFLLKSINSERTLKNVFVNNANVELVESGLNAIEEISIANDCTVKMEAEDTVPDRSDFDFLSNFSINDEHERVYENSLAASSENSDRQQVRAMLENSYEEPTQSNNANCSTRKADNLKCRNKSRASKKVAKNNDLPTLTKEADPIESLFERDERISINSSVTTQQHGKEKEAVALTRNKTKQLMKAANVDERSAPVAKTRLRRLSRVSYVEVSSDFSQSEDEYVPTHSTKGKSPNKKRNALAECNVLESSFNSLAVSSKGRKTPRKRLLSDESKQSTSAKSAKMSKMLSKSENKPSSSVHCGQFKCKICQTQFNFEQQLLRHLPMHDKRRPLECNICKLRFIFKSKLERHRSTHNEIKNYPCRKCSKAFHTKDGLRSHLTYHNTERKYTCEICGRAFVTKHDLKGHVLVHSQVKPFACDVCPKTFSQSSHLLSHRLTHKTRKFRINIKKC